MAESTRVLPRYFFGLSPQLASHAWPRLNFRIIAITIAITHAYTHIPTHTEQARHAVSIMALARRLKDSLKLANLCRSLNLTGSRCSALPGLYDSVALQHSVHDVRLLWNDAQRRPITNQFTSLRWFSARPSNPKRASVVGAAQKKAADQGLYLVSLRFVPLWL